VLLRLIRLACLFLLAALLLLLLLHLALLTLFVGCALLLLGLVGHDLLLQLNCDKSPRNCDQSVELLFRLITPYQLLTFTLRSGVS